MITMFRRPQPTDSDEDLLKQDQEFQQQETKSSTRISNVGKRKTEQSGM